MRAAFRAPLAGLADLALAQAFASATLAAAGNTALSEGFLTPANIALSPSGVVIAAVVKRPKASGVFVFDGGLTATAAGADAAFGVLGVLYTGAGDVSLTGGAVSDDGIHLEIGSGGGQAVVVVGSTTTNSFAGGQTQVAAGALIKNIGVSGMITLPKKKNSVIAVIGTSAGSVAYSAMELAFNLYELP